MRLSLFLLAFFISQNLFAISCDCEVRVYPPTTGSHQLGTMVLAHYELENFGTYSVKNQLECRKGCQEQFEEDMNVTRLNALLLKYSQRLIDEKLLGYNCTGLTTLKYPVRVHARLGRLGLGNVIDIVQVMSHEEACFSPSRF